MKKQCKGLQEKESTKHTLIINYPNLSAGGIEVGLVSLIRFFLNEGHRVIWITTTHHLNEVAFKGIVDDPRLEIVISEKWNRYFSIPHIHFRKEEQVIMITCRAMQYVVSEGMRRVAGTKEFKHFLLVAHFSGTEYYPDHYFKSKWGHEIAYRFWRTVVHRLVENDCLRGFSLKHLECYEDYYQVSISSKKEKLMPDFNSNIVFDMKNAQNKSKERKDKFVITTCTRFEFPHKAYVLGLVDSFNTIKAKYPQAVLRIIGYGNGEAELKEKICQLAENVQKDIELVGMVSHDELERYYKDSHLIIGLAGAIIDGAQSGIPSLVVRHYCCDCETYGFFEDAFEKTLSEEKGENVIPFIESCITMDQEEYIDHAQKGFMARAAFLNADPDSFFKQNTDKNEITVRFPWESALGRILFIITELKNRAER